HHDLERFRHPLPAVVAAESVADELVLVVVGAVPDADVQTPAREIVEERELGGEADGMAEGELDHGEADADAHGASGHHAGEWDRVAVHALAREVVLGEPDAVEAGRLRETGLGDEIFDRRAVGVSGRGMSERQPSESHASTSLWKCPARTA